MGLCFASYRCPVCERSWGGVATESSPTPDCPICGYQISLDPLGKFKEKIQPAIDDPPTKERMIE